MTVQSEDPLVAQIADGVAADFIFPMKTYDSNWIEVYEGGILTPGIVVVTLNADQKNNPGGSVNITPVPVDGTVVIINRVVDLDQFIDFTAYSGFPAELNEDALDKLTFIAQQIRNEQVRSVRQSILEPARNMQLPDINDRASRFQTFDEVGNVQTSDILAQGVAIELGSASLVGDNIVAVTFQVQRLNAEYKVFLTSDDSESVFWTDKTTTGFNANTPAFSADTIIDWMVIG